MEFDDFIVKCRRYIEHLRHIFVMRRHVSEAYKKVSSIRKKIRDIKVCGDGTTTLNTTVYLYTNDVQCFNIIVDKLQSKGYRANLSSDIAFNRWRGKYGADIKVSW